MSDTSICDDAFCEAQDLEASAFVVPLGVARQLEHKLAAAQARTKQIETGYDLLKGQTAKANARIAELEKEILDCAGMFEEIEGWND